MAQPFHRQGASSLWLLFLPKAFSNTTLPVTMATQHPHMNQDGAAEETISLNGVSY